MQDSIDEGERLAIVAMHYGLVDSVSSGKVKVMCPLHDDKNPSMSLDFNTGMWYCFGCGESGKAQKLSMMIEKRKGLNDVKALSEFNKIIRCRGSGSVTGKIHVRRSSEVAEDKRELYAIAYDFYKGLSSVDWRDPQFIEAEEVADYMMFRGFTARTMNMSKAKVTFQQNYPMVFPINDNGKFRGWLCRAIDEDVAARRKYLYNKGFSRATTLDGDYGKKFKGRKLDGMLMSKFVFFVEGHMDMLKFKQFGIHNVVAVLGWKLTDEQIAKLKSSGVSHAVSAFDNDKAGRNGCAYAKTKFETVDWVYEDGIKDPGDMDRESFNRMLKKTFDRMENKRWDL